MKSDNTHQAVVLEYQGKKFDFPLITGSENEVGIDISSLRAKTGLITLDNGYMNTGSCESSITFLDGENGVLRYRGYAIEELAEKSSFIETSYLLIYGELPSEVELRNFTNALTRHTMIHEDMKRFYDGFPRDAHPMATLSAAVNTLSTFYQHEETSVFDPVGIDLAIHRLLAKLPTIAAFAYKKSIGQPFIYPTNTLGYASNFLKMMFAVPAENYQVDEDVAKALDLLLILHADHEQNCSTSTVRMVGSSQASLYASISAGICALWGPLHGGANQAVIEMLEEILRTKESTKKFIEKVKDKNSSERLMGFGHRVYKNFDPRAKIIKKACNTVLDKLGLEDPLLDIARELESVALSDPYFIERKLYPNVDFYSGIIYRALGIPETMFTVMFALGRLPGWIAQWKEMISSKSKIGRPRQIYQGSKIRPFIPISQRS